MAAEGLEDGEDDLTGGGIDRESLDEVEPSVRTGVVLLVKSVEVHDSDELFAADGSFVEVLHIGADGVVAIGDV